MRISTVRSLRTLPDQNVRLCSPFWSSKSVEYVDRRARVPELHPLQVDWCRAPGRSQTWMSPGCWFSGVERYHPWSHKIQEKHFWTYENSWKKIILYLVGSSEANQEQISPPWNLIDESIRSLTPHQARIKQKAWTCYQNCCVESWNRSGLLRCQKLVSWLTDKAIKRCHGCHAVMYIRYTWSREDLQWLECHWKKSLYYHFAKKRFASVIIGNRYHRVDIKSANRLKSVEKSRKMTTKPLA